MKLLKSLLAVVSASLLFAGIVHANAANPDLPLSDEERAEAKQHAELQKKADERRHTKDRRKSSHHNAQRENRHSDRDADSRHRKQEDRPTHTLRQRQADKHPTRVSAPSAKHDRDENRKDDIRQRASRPQAEHKQRPHERPTRKVTQESQADQHKRKKVTEHKRDDKRVLASPRHDRDPQARHHIQKEVHGQTHKNYPRHDLDRRQSSSLAREKIDSLSQAHDKRGLIEHKRKLIQEHRYQQWQDKRTDKAAQIREKLRHERKITDGRELVAKKRFAKDIKDQRYHEWRREAKKRRHVSEQHLKRYKHHYGPHLYPRGYKTVNHFFLNFDNLGWNPHHRDYNHYFHWYPISFSWDVRYRHVPEFAIVAGFETDRPVHLCQAPYRSHVIPGKLSHGRCYIPYHGQEIARDNYRILSGEDFYWFADDGYKLPENAVVGGVENNEPIYVCRTRYGKYGTFPGKLVGDYCYIAHGGLEVRSSIFDILLWG